MHQLVQATHPLPGNPDETFNYDEAGNRLFRDGQAFSGVFDAANRLLEDENFTYDYDENGNLIQKADKTTAVITEYTYDAEDQLIRVDLPGGTFAQYSYDALGRRIEKDVNGSLTRYVYDFSDILFEFDGTPIPQARYTHGLGIDYLLMMERGGSAFFYHRDGITSVTDLTNAAGSVAQSYVYDSFGNIVQESASLANPFTYTSRERDEETGLYYHRARYYDATIGRFLQEDLIAGSLRVPVSLNRYLYAENNPLFFADPDGLTVVNTGGLIIDPNTGGVDFGNLIDQLGDLFGGGLDTGGAGDQGGKDKDKEGKGFCPLDLGPPKSEDKPKPDENNNNDNNKGDEGKEEEKPKDKKQKISKGRQPRGEESKLTPEERIDKAGNDIDSIKSSNKKFNPGKSKQKLKNELKQFGL